MALLQQADGVEGAWAAVGQGESVWLRRDDQGEDALSLRCGVQCKLRVRAARCILRAEIELRGWWPLRWKQSSVSLKGKNIARDARWWDEDRTASCRHGRQRRRHLKDPSHHRLPVHRACRFPLQAKHQGEGAPAGQAARELRPIVSSRRSKDRFTDKWRRVFTEKKTLTNFKATSGWMGQIGRHTEDSWLQLHLESDGGHRQAAGYGQ